MKYKSGIEVIEGDVVAIRGAERWLEGVVLEVILPSTPDAHAWSAPNGGVLIEGGGLAYRSLNPWRTTRMSSLCVARTANPD